LVIYSIVIVSITLILAEIVLRMVFDEFDPEQKLEFKMMDPGYQLGPAGYSGRHTKNTGDFDVAVEINNDGFRDSKSLTDSNSEHWFLVGDSFSFGFGVEAQHRFSNLLETRLDSSIFNISIPNNLQGYYFLVEHARQQGAEIGRLMIGVCMENDLANYSQLKHTEPVTDVSEIPRNWNMGRIKYFLSTRSAVYMAMTKLVHHTPWLRKLAIESGLLIANLDGIPVTDHSRSMIESSVDQLERIADIDGINDVLVILIPSRGLWLEDLSSEHEKIHYDFVDSLRSSGLNFIDLRNEFENSGDPLQFHFSNDGHWNQKGHALAASAIATYLRNR
jgi:hypothetical protein